jgi:hypothetical protein
MGVGAAVTPQEYVDRVRTLVSAGRDADALRLAAEHAREVVPQLDAEQFAVTTSLLESAQLVVDMADAAGRQPQAANPPHPDAPRPQVRANRRRA